MKGQSTPPQHPPKPLLLRSHAFNTRGDRERERERRVEGGERSKGNRAHRHTTTPFPSPPGAPLFTTTTTNPCPEPPSLFCYFTRYISPPLTHTRCRLISLTTTPPARFSTAPTSLSATPPLPACVATRSRNCQFSFTLSALTPAYLLGRTSYYDYRRPVSVHDPPGDCLYPAAVMFVTRRTAEEGNGGGGSRHTHGTKKLKKVTASCSFFSIYFFVPGNTFLMQKQKKAKTKKTQ